MLYNKLVRDKIPQIIESKGNQAIVEVLDSNDYKKFLDLKLGEELQEYIDSDNVEELADLVEVIHAILKHKGVEIKDFEEIRTKKVYERGSFDSKILLKEVK